MQFVIEQKTFAEALAKISGIVQSRCDVPILRHILITANAASVSVRATDCDLEASVTVPAEVSAQGACTVDGRLLPDLVRKCPSGATLAVSTSSERLETKIACGRANYRLASLSPDDFPQLDAGAGGTLFTMQARDLRGLIEATLFAASDDETRYYLGGVYLHPDAEAGTLVAVATDGHRVSVKTTALPFDCAAMPGIIVPAATAGQLLKILPDSDVEVEVVAAGNRLTVSLGGTQIVSKLVDGTFPDYRRVIPQQGENVAIVPREALLKAVARVATVLDEKRHAVGLRFEADSVTVLASGVIGGNSARDMTDGVTYDGKPVTVGVNARYLDDLLHVFSAAQLAVQVADANAPLLWGEVDGDGSHRIVQMPVRIGPEMEKAD